MTDLTTYEDKRNELRQRYLSGSPDTAHPSEGVWTGGVDHLALICSDIEATIRFYTEVLKMRVSGIMQNRDEPTSTHIFLDMGGGNQLAFFDFPLAGPSRTVRGVGGMHHVAIKAEPEKYRAVIATLKSRRIPYSIHGTEAAGSLYLRDPDGIKIEITTGFQPG